MSLLISQRSIMLTPTGVKSLDNSWTADGTVRGFEYEAYRKDGSRIWMSDSVRTVRNDRRGSALLRRHRGRCY